LQKIGLPGMFIYVFGFAWKMLVIICAVGLLRLNSSGRVVLVKLCLANIIAIFIFITPMLIMLVLKKTLMLALLNNVLPLAVMFIYVIYLTRPGVKQQFS
jgi:hypothetical protein